MEELKLMFRKMFDYSGRARRREYWIPQIWISLFGVVEYFVLIAVIVLVEMEKVGIALVVFIVAIAMLLGNVAICLASLSLTVRRYHDIGKSGYWILLVSALCLIGFGSIVHLVFLCADSDADNQWGVSPKGYQRRAVPPHPYYGSQTGYGNGQPYGNQQGYGNSQFYGNNQGYGSQLGYDMNQSYGNNQGYDGTQNYGGGQNDMGQSYDNAQNYTSSQGYSYSQSNDTYQGYDNSQNYGNAQNGTNYSNYDSYQGQSYNQNGANAQGYGNSTNDVNQQSYGNYQDYNQNG